MQQFIELEGRRVVLQPLELTHVEQLFSTSRSAKLWEKLPIHIQTLDEMRDFVNRAIENKNIGLEFPYVVFDKQTNRVVGTTRYLRISEIHKNINIGWTWYSEDVWGTSVNIECKYLLLRQAFESWGAVRVEIITTVDHVRSQRAIERIGAVKEGVLRKKYNNRDYVFYSIIDEEWGKVRSNMEALLT